MTYKITHNGKQYEIGRLYQAEDGIGVLKGITTNKRCFVVGDNNSDWHSEWIVEILDGDTAGKVTDAPIELEEGCWYMCEINGFEIPFLCAEDGFKTPYGGHAKGELTPLYKMERAK